MINTMWHIFTWMYALFLFCFIYCFSKQFYILRKRREWIKLDRDDFEERCPSFDYLVYKKFWIWDMKKFGFNPLIKLEKDFAQYFYTPEELTHAVQESRKRSSLQT